MKPADGRNGETFSIRESRQIGIGHQVRRMFVMAGVAYIMADVVEIARCLKQFPAEAGRRCSDCKPSNN